MKSQHYIGLLLGTGMAVLLDSCTFRGAEWNTEILAPLVKTRLGLDQVLDQENLDSDSSKTLHLVFQKSLYDLSIDSLFHFSDTSSRRTFKIDSLSLYSSTIDYPISLATLARNAGTTGQLLLFLHGTSQVIPSIPPIAPAAVPINADTLFTTMTLDKGNLDLSLYNGLPIAITDAQFELRNEMDKSLIVSGSFPFIGPNETVSRQFDLSGKTVEGRLLAQLVSLSSPGSNGVPVLIDTAATINASLKVYNLHPSTATAIWPAQDLINSSYYFRLKGLPVELKESRLKSGTVRITLYSTLEDSVRFSYRLPGATKNGVPLEAFKTLDPAPPGSTSRYVREENMAGYHWDLSGLNGDSFNIAFNEIIGSVDSTGVMKTFSTQDSLYAELAFLDIRPSYARGYLNDTTLFAGPNVVPLDFFNKVKGGRLDLEQATLDIDISNKVGVDMQVKINSLKAINNRTNETVVLDAIPLQDPIEVIRATDANGQLPIQSSDRRIGLTAQNSNMLEFISNLPDQISYDLELRTNPLGNVSQHRDFIYDGEYMNLNMNLDIPMKISARGLTLTDTLLLNLEDEDVSAIKGGTLHAFFDNGFPMDARIEIYLLNSEGAVMDTLMNGSELVKAAVLNAEGLVELTRQSRIDIPLDPVLLNSILTSGQVAVVITLDTQPVNQLVRILDRYGIDFQLTADFTYSID